MDTIQCTPNSTKETIGPSLSTSQPECEADSEMDPGREAIPDISWGWFAMCAVVLYQLWIL